MISVCITTYNGERYICDQLKSILCQLGEDDEVLINDDQSKDSTVQQILSIGDSRIDLVVNKENLGYVRNFEACIKRSSGEHVFLSDQDDIWPMGRVSSMIKAQTSSEKGVLFGGYRSFQNDIELNEDTSSHTLPKFGSDEMIVRNLFYLFRGGRLPYFGSCVLVSKKALEYIIPFPNSDISHDHWIAISANIKNDIHHLNEVVTLRRIHGMNITNSNRRIYSKILTRLRWARAIFSFWLR